jgi:hypothetical protein
MQATLLKMSAWVAAGTVAIRFRKAKYYLTVVLVPP